MAAVTAGRPSRRKSRRIVSACAFLSNISLDGNINKETVGFISEKNTIKNGVENTTPKPQLSSPRQTSLLHSIAQPAPSGSESGGSKKVIGRQRSETEAMSDRRHHEIAMVMRRSMSMSESTDSSSTGTIQSANVHKGKHRVTCLMGSSFHLKRKAHDKRIVLCSAHKAPFVTYSVLKYHKENQEAGQEGMSVKKLSTSVPGQCAGIEGVELGSADKTVSYRSFLISKYPFGWSDSLNNQKVSGPLQVQVDAGAVTVPPLDGADGGASSIAGPYDPHLLDDPELMSGRHRKVLNLTSYLVSMVAYAKPSELKKDLNEQFREKFPSVNITLTKLRSLKREIVKIVTSQDCQLDLTTVAYAFVYFEKLILKEKISKANRKLLAGSCLLLAAKFNDDMKREKIKELIQAIEDRLRISVKELLKFEFQAVVALEFELHIPQWEVLPHLKRLESEQL